MNRDRPPLIVLGAGGFAHEVIEWANAAGHDVQLLVDDAIGGPGATAHGLPVASLDALPGGMEGVPCVAAIGATNRIGFIERAAKAGLPPGQVVHPTAHVGRSATLGPGVVIGPRVVIAAGATIGDHTSINRGALVGHHTALGTCCTVSPGANIGGDATIADGAYIGMGAVVLNQRNIGPRAVVGAGAVVTRDVPGRVQVMGVPARVTKENLPE